ncbi:hypothetical protein BJP07_07840 [Corynebacterium sp. NML130628]|nr:hypothetical protein BJP07_07840 [Corynebacterium sp. NML130628]
MSAGYIGWPLLVLFSVAVIVVTTLVDPRGLFLTVAATPLLFVAALLGFGVLSARGQLGAAGAGGKTALLMVLYPVIEHFPILFTVTTGALVIAVVRYWLIQRHNDEVLRRERALRRRMSQSNRRTNYEGRRARERSKGGITVAELLKRTNAERSQARPRGERARRVASRLGEDLYKNDGR